MDCFFYGIERESERFDARRCEDSDPVHETSRSRRVVPCHHGVGATSHGTPFIPSHSQSASWGQPSAVCLSRPPCTTTRSPSKTERAQDDAGLFLLEVGGWARPRTPVQVGRAPFRGHPSPEGRLLGVHGPRQVCATAGGGDTGCAFFCDKSERSANVQAWMTFWGGTPLTLRNASSFASPHPV